MEENFKVRDRRNKGWFFLDNDYLNGYTKLVSPYATLVYLSLCRHANSNQKAFPSIMKIAEEFSISEDSVRKGIKELKKINIIAVIRVGKRRNNEYWLIDKSEWIGKEKIKLYKNKRKSTKKSDPDDTGIISDHGNTRKVTPMIQESDPDDTGTKNTNRRKTNTKKTNIMSPTSDGAKINLLIEKFETINPSYDRLFSNTTQRKALERLVKKYTFEKVEAMIEVLPEVVSQKYAPQISTPLQLESKLGQLLIFIKQNEERQGAIKV